MADTDPAFLGRGWAFPPGLDTDGSVKMVAAATDIAESLRILMETRPGERVMHPDYGCNLHEYVFDPLSSETRLNIETAIRRAILFFEPRITLEAITTDLSDPQEGQLRVTLDYTIITTNERQNMVFPFYLSEGTLLSGTPQPA